jgi:hypothetical protein
MAFPEPGKIGWYSPLYCIINWKCPHKVELHPWLNRQPRRGEEVMSRIGIIKVILYKWLCRVRQATGLRLKLRSSDRVAGVVAETHISAVQRSTLDRAALPQQRAATPAADRDAQSSDRSPPSRLLPGAALDLLDARAPRRFTAFTPPPETMNAVNCCGGGGAGCCCATNGAKSMP